LLAEDFSTKKLSENFSKKVIDAEKKFEYSFSSVARKQAAGSWSLKTE